MEVKGAIIKARPLQLKQLTNSLARRGGAEVAGWTVDRKIRV